MTAPIVLYAHERHIVRFGAAVFLEMRAAAVADDLQSTAWGVPRDCPDDLSGRLREAAHLVGLIEDLDAAIAADETYEAAYEVPAAAVPVLEEIACRLAAEAAGPESLRVWSELAVVAHREALR